MDVDPDTTAIVVVDMQNDFCHPDGALYAPGSEDAIEPISSLVERGRAAGTEIAFTRDVHPEGQFEDAYYMNEFERWGKHVLEGSWGAEIVDGLAVEPVDLVIEKRTYDAFYGTDFETVLEDRGVTDLLFVGTLANVCVLHTAGSAGLRDFKPVLVSDALGYLEADHRRYALEHAEWVFGETTTRAAVEFL
ncbi:MAG: cysteine hydrolase [Halodesulfurarchaeum sp.]|nr:cysteine hydrolase [Halodesulfurarchaeum sp.]